MSGEKYIIVTEDNPLQIMIRNMLNPCGYVFLNTCGELSSLMRNIRTCDPDFLVIDFSLNKMREFRRIIELIDDEMICPCIIIGEEREFDMVDIFDKSNVLYFCQKPISKDILINTVQLGIMDHKRVSMLNRKLKEMTDNFETRKLVEKAKHILMDREKLTENEAYTKMRKKSMDSRITMKAIAEAIIITYELTK